MFDGFFNVFHAFRNAGVEDPIKEALSVLEIVSKGSVSLMDDIFPLKTNIEFQDIIDMRCSGMPLEYILGSTTFMNRDFYCSPGALIPRKETELLAKTAINLAKGIKDSEKPLLIVDMGTGSGNLAVSIAAHAENTHILACDVSPDAVELAWVNVRHHKMESRVSLLLGDLFAPLEEKNYHGLVDMIVCNPPYIPTASLAKLEREIIEHEPVVALDAGVYGIDIFRKLILQSPDFLKPGGLLVFEIGMKQDKFVTRLLQNSGKYGFINHHPDKSGTIRVISAMKA